MKKSKIYDISSLKASITQSLQIVFSGIFLTALIVFLALHEKYSESKRLLNQQEIHQVINTYKSGLSEKLSIIASSYVFMDYLRSGDITRKKMMPDFLAQLIALKSNSVVGMVIRDHWGGAIFSYGEKSRDYVTFNICYLNQTLDSKMGECYFSWTLFFDKDKIYNELFSLDKSILHCPSCEKFSFLSGPMFGSFPVKSSSNISLSLMVLEKSDYFYFYYIILCFSLLLLGLWSWYRLGSLINNYVSEPMIKLTSCLKLDSTMDNINHIKEIQYLVNEISNWRNKINKNLAEQHAVNLGKIAAQLAHDIRSPLSVINMAIKKITQKSDSSLLLIKNSSRRIEDIANSFLIQYRNKGEGVFQAPTTVQYLPQLVDLIFFEKKAQYSDKPIVFSLDITDKGRSVFCIMNEVEFERLISNLVSNAVESIIGSGSVSILLDIKNNMAYLTVTDTGKGIPAHLLSDVSKGGLSMGKVNGSGLGLSHARATIESWRGSLNLDSVEGLGTKITIFIPLASSPNTPSV
ncbi:MAG TPA: HAMP domain-containing sensor histidine kinase [Gammaproteobacteria bacterium]|nr:HAMP domain-containing sensor histidine kinase [Gammaproteobacteria bacterium]